MTAVKALVGAWDFGTAAAWMQDWVLVWELAGKNPAASEGIVSCHAVSAKILFQYLVFHAQVISSSFYEFFSQNLWR